MTFSMPERKPNIHSFGGTWYCSGDGVNVGQGPTPAIAFKRWRAVQIAMRRWHSCDPDKAHWG